MMFRSILTIKETKSEKKNLGSNINFLSVMSINDEPMME